MTPPRKTGLARAVAVLEGTAAFLLLVLMLLVLVDVVLRNTVNRPLAWSTEVLEVALGAMVFLLYPVLAFKGGGAGGHITVDLISTPPAVQRVQKLVAGLVGGVLFGLIGWCLGRQALRAADYGDGTTLLHLPYAWILGGMGVLSVLALGAFVVSIARVLRPTGDA